MEPIVLPDLAGRLEWPKQPVDLVLDTDTFNEIDDQFALVYALLSKQRMNLQAVYAAPFHNKRSTGPADGMQKSYEEILRILELMQVPADGFAHRGSRAWISQTRASVASAARDDLISRARARTSSPLYVTAIGAITNIASAILAAPDIREKIVILWLAGHPLYWPETSEFNMQGDPDASRVILDSGVPLVLFPCRNVSEMLRTTEAELAKHVAGKSRIGDYLYRILRDYESNPPLTTAGKSKVIWDLAPLAWLVDQGWVSTTINPSPILTADLKWRHDSSRHPIRVAAHIFRDGLFADLFAKLSAACRPGGLGRSER